MSKPTQGKQNLKETEGWSGGGFNGRKSTLDTTKPCGGLIDPTDETVFAISSLYNHNWEEEE